METIKPTEVSRIISLEIPEVKNEVNKLSGDHNVAAVLQVVINYIREMLVTHNLERANQCIILIGQIYGRGNTMVQDIIENLFVRSFNGMKRLCGPIEWQKLQIKIPWSLRKVYVLQNRYNR